MTMDKFPVFLLHANFSIPSLAVYSMREPCGSIGKVDDNYVHFTTHVGITGNNNLLSFFFEGKQGKACINSLLFFTYPSAVKESRNLPVFAGEENSSIPQIEELFLDITKRTLKEIQLTLLL